MVRHAASSPALQAATLQASRKMIARGDRPGFRVVEIDGRWVVDELPWMVISPFAARDEARDSARQTIARWLDVDPWTFDLE